MRRCETNVNALRRMGSIRGLDPPDAYLLDDESDVISDQGEPNPVRRLIRRQAGDLDALPGPKTERAVLGYSSGGRRGRSPWRAPRFHGHPDSVSGCEANPILLLAGGQLRRPHLGRTGRLPCRPRAPGCETRSAKAHANFDQHRPIHIRANAEDAP